MVLDSTKITRQVTFYMIKVGQLRQKSFLLKTEKIFKKIEQASS
jgi:hypothetical protein